MLREIRYEVPMEHVDFNIPTIFLAGPTVRGNQPNLISWRFEAIELFKQKSFDGQLIVPEFTDKTQSDQYRYDIPVWEYNGLQKCHVIMFWVPRLKELIGLTTNHEHGYWMAREREKMVYGRPDDAYRITYLDIMWVEDGKRSHWSNKCPIYNKLSKTVDAALELIKTRKPH